MKENYTIEDGELLLRNTFLNAQIGPFADFSKASVPKQKKKFKLKWMDHATGKKANLARELDRNKDLINKKKVKKINVHRITPVTALKSIHKEIFDQQGIV